MAIRLYNFIALLLIATMSAVVSLFIYLFTINFISQGKSLNFVPKDQQVRKCGKIKEDIMNSITKKYVSG